MKSIIYLFIAMLFVFSCQGPEGEIGPKGDTGVTGSDGTDGTDGTDGVNGADGVGFEKRGFVEGTITGIRNDGTAFSEPFKFEYGPTPEGFKYSEEKGYYVFETYRYLGQDFEDSHINLYLRVNNKDLPNESLSLIEGYYPVDINFQKEISVNALFLMEASVDPANQLFTHPVNPTLNTSTYKFTTFGTNGNYFVSIYDEIAKSSAYVLQTTDGKRVYFQEAFENYENVDDYYYGDLIKVLDVNGNVISNSPYDQLRLSTPDSDPNQLIFRDLSGQDLSSSVTLPGDTFVVSNYQRSATTSLLTFDFTLTIGAIGRQNTTKHQLTIAGKFNSGGKVYSNVVSRKGKG